LERVGWLWTSDCCVDEEATPALRAVTLSEDLLQSRHANRRSIRNGLGRAPLPVISRLPLEEAQTPHTVQDFSGRFTTVFRLLAFLSPRRARPCALPAA
jgi:hypothetical protein